VTERRCDVAVIGAGPAGMAAAVRAAAAGRSVIVLDEAPRAGGQVWRHASRVAALPATARRWLRWFEACGAELVSGATVVDVFSRSAAAPAAADAASAGGGATVHDASGAGAAADSEQDFPYLELTNRDRAHGAAGAARSHGPLEHWIIAEPRAAAEPLLVRAGAVVLATGARERFLPFPGWTLPGVLGAGGAQALLRGGLAVVGRRVVVAGSGPLLLAVAAALARAGAQVLEVAEQADARAVGRFTLSLWRTPLRLAQAAGYRAAFARAPYRTGTWVVSADAATGGVLSAVTLIDGRGTRTLPCDMLCTGYGLVPATELARLLGCAVEGGRVIVDDAQGTTVPGVWCAGDSTGVGGSASAVVEGEIAGMAAAGGTAPPRLLRSRSRRQAVASSLQLAFALRAELRARIAPDTVVCRCEDARWDDVRACGSARDAKLAVRAGMGPCQARVCGPALEYLLGWTTDTVRPPVLPARVSTLIESGAAAAAAPGDQ
jgi:D-hydroxyproline dehydrogenase subunit alpha